MPINILINEKRHAPRGVYSMECSVMKMNFDRGQDDYDPDIIPNPDEAKILETAREIDSYEQIALFVQDLVKMTKFIGTPEPTYFLTVKLKDPPSRQMNLIEVIQEIIKLKFKDQLQ